MIQNLIFAGVGVVVAAGLFVVIFKSLMKPKHDPVKEMQEKNLAAKRKHKNR